MKQTPTLSASWSVGLRQIFCSTLLDSRLIRLGGDFFATNVHVHGIGVVIQQVTQEDGIKHVVILQDVM